MIACDKIRRYTKPFDNAQSLLHSELEWDATIRELEIIGEATKYLLNSDLLDRKFRIVVDFRNMITHKYFGIDELEVWNVITKHIIEFEKSIFKVLELFDKDMLIEAIDCSIEDFKYNQKVVDLLNNLKDKIDIK
jgi:uncharacterized protein with HEPN domain